MEKNLTTRQLLFCKEYLKDLNAAQAAIRAGYSEKTAKEIGCENLTKPNIQEYIAKRTNERMAKIDISADEVLRVIKETMLESKNDGDRPNTYRGAELLGKHLSLFVDKVDHTGDINVTITKRVLSARDKD